jgi:NAD(P)-dependent dehydrogenase (short-subunit alcohol dehydrogenase family)
MLLRDKVVIVSGVGPGLGRELARMAGREGASVVLAARSGGFLREVAREIEAAGARALPVSTDITSTEACRRLVEVSVEAFGGVDILINSAYAFGASLPFEEADLDAWNLPMQVNYFGSLRLTQQVVPRLKERGGGSIVMVGTIGTRRPRANEIGYAASKSALHTAARNLALELGPHGIRVNSVLTGWIWGETVQAGLPGLAREQGITEEELLDRIRSLSPLGTLPTDADCANAILFLASDLARAITGATLDINAGTWMP